LKENKKGTTLADKVSCWKQENNATWERIKVAKYIVMRKKPSR
jgi:hypothetical protein